MLSGFTIVKGKQTVRIKGLYKKCLNTTARLKARLYTGNDGKGYYHFEVVWKRAPDEQRPDGFSCVGKSFAPAEFTEMMFAALFKDAIDRVDKGGVFNDIYIKSEVNILCGENKVALGEYPKGGDFTLINKNDVWYSTK